MSLYDLVDIGANLGHHSYAKDLNEVLSRAKQSGVSKIMVTGTNLKSGTEGKNFAETHPGFLYFTAGFHPHDAKEWDSQSLEELKKLLNHPGCVAVGECGLDFNRNFSPQDVQKTVFKKQVELALELKKPMFIHERDAHDDMVKILEPFLSKLPPTVIHCFTGTITQAQKYIEMGFFIGLTGFLWKDKTNDGVQAGLRSGQIPIEKVVIETDAPYMYPKVTDKKLPKDVKNSITAEALAFHKHSSFNRNEPCSLPAVCELIAAFANRDPIDVARITTENAKQIYGLN